MGRDCAGQRLACGSVAVRLRYRRQDLVDAEARRLLAWREVPECPDELGHKGLRRDKQEYSVDFPVPVGVRRDVRALVWVKTQIK